MNTDRQRTLLAFLLVLLAIVGWRYVKPLLLGGDDAVARARRAERQAVIRGEIANLDLDRLEVPARNYQPGRNPFRYGPREVVAPPPPPPPPPQTVVVQPPPPPPPTVRQPPRIDVSLVGIFGPKSRRIAVFKDGPDIVNVLEEDVIKQKFIVHEIGLEWVDLAFVGFPDVKPQRVSMTVK